jgi:hypothetical protein
LHNPTAGGELVVNILAGAGFGSSQEINTNPLSAASMEGFYTSAVAVTNYSVVFLILARPISL